MKKQPGVRMAKAYRDGVMTVRRKLMNVTGGSLSDAQAISRLKHTLTSDDFQFIDFALLELPTVADYTKAARWVATIASSPAPSTDMMAVPVVLHGAHGVDSFNLAKAVCDESFRLSLGAAQNRLSDATIVVFPVRALTLRDLYVFSIIACSYRSESQALAEFWLQWPAQNVLMFAFPKGDLGVDKNEACAAIEQRVLRINRDHPDWRCEALPLSRMDQAVRTADMAATRRRYRTAFAEFTRDTGPANLEIHSGFKAISTLTTRADGHTIDVLLTQDVAISTDLPEQPKLHIDRTLPLQYNPSLLFDCDDLRQTLDPVFAEFDISVSWLAPAREPDSIPTPEFPMRDLDGVWRRKLLIGAMPLQSRQLLLGGGHWIDVVEAENEEDYSNLMAYPYPLRLDRLNPVGRVCDHFRKDVADRIRELVATPGMGYHEYCQRMARAFPYYMAIPSLPPHQADPLSVPVYFFEALHFLKCEGPLVFARDTLVERMQMTELSLDIPLARIHPPFPDSYIHLETPLPYATAEGAPVRLNGFFVSERTISQDKWELTLCPVVTQGADVITSIPDAFEFVLEADSQLTLFQALGDFYRLPPEDVESDARGHMVQLVIKILIYMNVKSARIVNRSAGDDVSALRLPPRGRGERNKDSKKHERAFKQFDFIEIGPEQSMREEREISERQEGGRKLFWRRGHQRNQAHGHRWSLHRWIQIPPTLVNAQILGEDEVPPRPKNYDLK
ncbi:hypothetical protein AB4Y45_35185 [Paraburkholderia sp. EG287A]|uniref:hypothetical protein n=1 Tax=Paraburkholderia sp. EG287A TaxID=3237012 RepID=UPI0034D1617B